MHVPRAPQTEGCGASRLEVHIPQEFCVTWVRAQAVEHRPAFEVNQRLRPFFIGLLEPFKRSILITETGIDDCEVIGRDIAVLCQLPLLMEYFERLITAAGYSVSIPKHRLSIPSLRSIFESYGLLKFTQSLLIHFLFHVGLAQEKVELSVIWTPLCGLQIQLNCRVILASVKVNIGHTYGHKASITAFSKLFRAFGIRKTFNRSPNVHQIAVEHAISIKGVGVEVQGPFEFLLRTRPVPIALLNVSQYGVRLGECVIKRHRLLRRPLRSLP